jgi:hypothetical protein
MRATEFLVGLHLDAFAPKPELQRSQTRTNVTMNSRGSGDPSEGPVETGSPPQAPPGRPGRHPDLKLEVEPPTSCFRT